MINSYSQLKILSEFFTGFQGSGIPFQSASGIYTDVTAGIGKLSFRAASKATAYNLYAPSQYTSGSSISHLGYPSILPLALHSYLKL